MLNTSVYTVDQQIRIANIDAQRQHVAQEAAKALLEFQAIRGKDNQQAANKFNLYKAHKARLDELSEELIDIMCE